MGRPGNRSAAASTDTSNMSTGMAAALSRQLANMADASTGTAAASPSMARRVMRGNALGNALGVPVGCAERQRATCTNGRMLPHKRRPYDATVISVRIDI